MAANIDSSAISSLGVGSGLDLSSLLNSLKSSEQARLQPLRIQEASYKAQLSAYGQIQNVLTKLQGAADALNDNNLYHASTVSTSGDAFTAKGGADAVPGRYQVAVSHLAQSQSLVAGAVASQTDTIGNGGTIAISLGDGSGNVSKSVNLTIDSQDSTLEGIRDAINGADIGVSASIINDGSDTPYRLVLSSDATGTDSQISVTATDTNGGSALSSLLDYDSATGNGALQQTVAAQNAQLTVNDIPIISQSNTIKDAIQGVSLDLTATTTSPQTVTTARDTDGVKKAISSFVSAYNAYHSVSDKLTAYNGQGKASGVLLGDSATRTVQSRLLGALNTPVSGGSFSGLPQIGVTLQADGSMKIDDDKLDAAIANDPGGVAALLGGNSETGDKGVASLLSDAIENLTGTGGAVQAATSGTQATISGLNDRMSQVQSSINSTIANYREQFVKLDSLMSKLNSTQSYLTTQLAQLNGTSGSSNSSGS